MFQSGSAALAASAVLQWQESNPCFSLDNITQSVSEGLFYTTVYYTDFSDFEPKHIPAEDSPEDGA